MVGGEQKRARNFPASQDIISQISFNYQEESPIHLVFSWVIAESRKPTPYSLF